MKRETIKRCHACGRLYDGFECPECGWYAQEYANRELFGDIEEYEDEEDCVDEDEAGDNWFPVD